VLKFGIFKNLCDFNLFSNCLQHFEVEAFGRKKMGLSSTIICMANLLLCVIYSFLEFFLHNT